MGKLKKIKILTGLSKCDKIRGIYLYGANVLVIIRQWRDKNGEKRNFD